MSGTVADLLHAQDVVEIVLAQHYSASEVAARLQFSEQVMETQGNVLRLPGTAQQRILAVLVEANIPISSLNPLSQTLEDVYVQITGNDGTVTKVGETGTEINGVSGKGELL